MTNKKYGVKVQFTDGKFLINYSNSEEIRDKNFENLKKASWSESVVFDTAHHPIIVNLRNVLYCEKIDY